MNDNVVKKTKIMGILNVTPDSFSDGGEYDTIDKAISHATEMVENGANIIDVGGESTRPGFDRIDADEEIRRVIPVVSVLRQVLPRDVEISVDTTKVEVAKAGIEAGIDIINDVSGKFKDNCLIDLAVQHNKKYVFVHNAVTDNFCDVKNSFIDFLEYAEKKGLPFENIILDPGIGFGKEQDLNEEIVRRISELTCLGASVMMAASRKRLVGNILKLPVTERFEGDAAVVVLAVAGGCSYVRVHDVKKIEKVLRVADKIIKG